MLTKTNSVSQSNLKEKKYSLREAFGKDFPANQFILGYEACDCQYVPKPIKNWKWDRDVLRTLAMWWEQGTVGEGLHAFGYPGAGKTGSLHQFCASLQIPFYSKTIVQSIEFNDLVLTVNLANGHTIPSYAWLPLAMGAEDLPGIFCASEVDRGDPALLVGLNDVLDGYPLMLSNMELECLHAHPRFRIATTGNTAMAGDTTGLYVTARQQDYSFQDRFWKLPVRYLDPDVEEQLLVEEVPSLDANTCKVLVKCANELRKAFIGSFNPASTASAQSPAGSTPAPAGAGQQPQRDRKPLTMTMTTRTLVRWAHGTARFEKLKALGISPVYYALDLAFLNSAVERPPLWHALNTIVTGLLGDRPPAQARP